MLMIRRVFDWLCFTAVVLLTSAVGCSPEPNTATVRGSVTYKGKPVTSGLVLFYAEAKANANETPVASAVIQGDGAYVTDLVPKGSVIVAIDPEPLAAISAMVNPTRGPRPKDGPEPAVPSSPSKSGMRLPDKYQRPETSGLKYTIDSRNQTIDIVLK